MKYLFIAQAPNHTPTLMTENGILFNNAVLNFTPEIYDSLVEFVKKSEDTFRQFPTDDRTYGVYSIVVVKMS